MTQFINDPVSSGLTLSGLVPGRTCSLRSFPLAGSFEFLVIVALRTFRWLILEPAGPGTCYLGACGGRQGSKGIFGGLLWASWVALGCLWGCLWRPCEVCGVVWPPDGGLGSPKEAFARNLGTPRWTLIRENQCELDVAKKCLEDLAQRLLKSDGAAAETYVTFDW